VSLALLTTRMGRAEAGRRGHDDAERNGQRGERDDGDGPSHGTPLMDVVN
jgi:hypothetical protein